MSSQLRAHFPFLAREILGLIVDELGKEMVDSKAAFRGLIACTQVPGLHHAARKHLFRTVAFKAQSKNTAGRRRLLKRLTTFLDFLRHKKINAYWVRSLRIYAECFDVDKKFWHRLANILPQILDHLTNVEEFRLRSGVLFEALHERLITSLTTFSTRPSLRTLRIAAMNFWSMEVLLTNPKLKHLALYSTQIIKPSSRSDIDTEHSCPILTSFSTYDTCPSSIKALWTWRPAMFSQLKKLSIGIDCGFTELVSTMLASLVNTLECLELTEMRRMDEFRPNGPSDWDVDLADLVALKHLTLRYGSNLDPVELSLPRLAWKFLSGTKSPTTLTSIEFAFGWGNSGHNCYRRVFLPADPDGNEESHEVVMVEDDDYSDDSNEGGPEMWTDDSASLAGSDGEAEIEEECTIVQEAGDSSADYELESDDGNDQETEDGDGTQRIDFWARLDEVLANGNFHSLEHVTVRLQFNGIDRVDKYNEKQIPEIDSDDEIQHHGKGYSHKWRTLQQWVLPRLKEMFTRSKDQSIRFEHFILEPFQGFKEYRR